MFARLAFPCCDVWLVSWNSSWKVTMKMSYLFVYLFIFILACYLISNPQEIQRKERDNDTPGVWCRLSTERSWFSRCSMEREGRSCSCSGGCDGAGETLWCLSQILCVLMRILEVLKQIDSLSSLINDETACTWFLNTCVTWLANHTHL